MSAAWLLVLALTLAQEYDALVARGVAAGKAARLNEAAAAFDLALRLDPGRPEALVERGGLRFLEGRYAASARDLGLSATGPRGRAPRPPTPTRRVARTP